ncbi:MAG: hypothetical protein RIR49_1234 [Actinomycetota bacterium]|jgi:hypothetical protein
MLDFFHHLRDHDGVAHAETARSLGVSWHRERRLIELGILDRPAHRVLRSTAVVETWRQRCRIATMTAGRGVISHGAAARLHGLDGFSDHPHVHLLCRKGSWPGPTGIVVTHFTRGLDDSDVTEVDGIPVLTVPATLAILRPHGGAEATSRAIASALASGWSVDEVRGTAERWCTRGRPGPRFVMEELDRLSASRRGPAGQASIGASISSAADHGSRRWPTTSPVTSSHRSPVHT